MLQCVKCGYCNRVFEKKNGDNFDLLEKKCNKLN